MPERINASTFLQKAKHLPVIDVRSPKEHAQGHIPGAFNIPLFTDEERAVVGTLYTKSGREASVLKGLEFAGPKLAGFIKTLHGITASKEVLVHCWRGGQRSGSMGWLYEQAGYRVHLLDGGYKAYRRFIREAFAEKADLTIIGGMTGTGKTAILHALAAEGEQVVDLEQIAHHKGSAFGSLGQGPQPTNEQFENDLYAAWSELDRSRRIWVEDESRSIGFVNIPDPLFEKMQQSRMIIIKTDRAERIRRLVEEYGRFPAEELGKPVLKISEKLGGARTKEALQLLRNNNLYGVVEMVLDYYDKSYDHAITRKDDKRIIRFDGSKRDAGMIAGELMRIRSNISI